MPSQSVFLSENGKGLRGGGRRDEEMSVGGGCRVLGGAVGEEMQ